MSWVTSGHHIFGIEHLLRQFWNRKSSVLLRTPGCQWRETGHEKVETRERNHVDCQFAEVGVELSGETEAGGDAGHCDGDEVIQVAVSGRRQLERAEANVVQGLVVDAVRFVSVFHQLMHFPPGSLFFRSTAIK